VDSFPTKDLSPEISRALLDACAEGESLRIPDWLQAFFRDEPTPRPERPLTPEERIRGLATVWAEAKYNFAYWDRLPGEAWWDEQFQAYIPLVAGAASDEEYWRLMESFGNLLRDGHTLVLPPPWLTGQESEPPLRIIAVEGRPVVLEGEGLPPGTEILAVDGRPAEEVRREVAASLPLITDQYREWGTARRLLRGPAGTEVQVRVRLPDGSEQEVRLRRTGPLPPRPPLEVRDLGDGLFHVAVNTMFTDETWQAFDRRFPDFAGVRGLILDLRWNNGGNAQVGWQILGRLIERPTRAAAVRMRCYLPTYRAYGFSQRWLVAEPAVIEPRRDLPTFTGPVAVLSSPITGSAAEDFLVAFRESRRGPIVGGPSCGSTGQTLAVPLPGGGAFLVCTKRDTFPDGTPFVGYGIQPDIPAALTIAGLAAGRDEVLERAVEALRTWVG